MPRVRLVALSTILALGGLIPLGEPAAAQTSATRGALFDGVGDTTLPAPSPLNQLFTSANDGWVHFPFAAADIMTLLRSSTFNGTAEISGRSYTVATAAAVDGYDGRIVLWDELWFGLSPSRDAAQCDFDALYFLTDREPEMVTFSDGTVKPGIVRTWRVGSGGTPGAKLGFLRLAPDPSLAGKHLCMHRDAVIPEVNNDPDLTYYDLQLSPIVVSATPITIDFAGSRYVPESVEEEDPEPAEADASEAEHEAEPDRQEAEDEGADAAADEDVDVEESTTSADQEETDTDPDADGGDTDGAEATDQPPVPTPAETAPTPEPDDDAATAAAGEDVTAAPDDVAGDDGGSGALVPTLAGLIGVLLAGIALVLVRGRRRADDTEDGTAMSVVAEPSGLGVADEGGAEGDAEGP